jgi:hypothetical protein
MGSLNARFRSPLFADDLDQHAQVVVNGRVEGDGLEPAALVGLMSRGDRGAGSPSVGFTAGAVAWTRRWRAVGGGRAKGGGDGLPQRPMRGEGVSRPARQDNRRREARRLYRHSAPWDLVATLVIGLVGHGYLDHTNRPHSYEPPHVPSPAKTQPPGYSRTNADQMKCKSKGEMQPKPCSCTNTMRRDFYLLKSCAGCGHD